MNKKTALFLACLAACFTTASSAMLLRTARGIINIPSGATGISLQGMSGGAGYPYINFFKGSHNLSFIAGGPGAAATPANLNNDGYPINGTLSSNIGMQIALPPKSSYNGDYIVGWTGGTCATTISFDGPSSVTPHTITGGLVVDFTNFGLGVHGTAGSVQFTVNNAIPPGSTAIYFSGGQTFTNCAGLYLIRADQLTAFNNNQVLNPDYITWFTNLNPKILRFMDWPDASGTADGNATDESLRPPYATAFSYRAERYPTGTWASGGVTGTNTLSISTYPNMPAGNYVDGETVQGIIANTQNSSPFSGVTDNGSGIMRLTGVTSTAGISNGTQVTVTTGGQSGISNASIFGIFTAANVVANTSIDLVGEASNVSGSFSGVVGPTQTLEVGTGRGGPKKLLLRLFIPQVPDLNRHLDIKAGDIGTFSYVKDADAWLYSGGGNDANGLAYGAPFEVFIEACNRANKDCWINLNAQLTDGSITSLVTYAKNNLNPALNLYLEWGNEVWIPNSGYSLYAAFAGQKAGYPVQNGNAQLRNPAWHSYYARQITRVKTLAAAAWSGRTTSNANVVLANQAISFPLNDPVKQLRFNSNWVGTRYAISTPGITNASPAVVTAPGHTFSVGDKVMIGGAQNTLWRGADTYSDYLPTCGMTEIENQALTYVPYTVHFVSGSQITLYDSTNTNPVNSTSYGTWGATAPTITVTGAPSSGTVWTVSGGHHLQTGQTIQLTGGTPPSPFKTNITYYVSSNNFTTTTFSLRPSPIGYGSPTDFDIVATGAGSGTITFTQTGCGAGQIWKIPASANQAWSMADVFSGAYYYNGPQLTTNGAIVAQGDYFSVANVAGSTNLLGQAYNYVNGNTAAKNAAIAFTDNDTRQGTYAPVNVASNNCPNATATFTMPLNVDQYEMNGFGLTNQNIVFLFGTPPTGFSTNTPYFIRNSTVGAKTFELAAMSNINVSLGCSGAGGAIQTAMVGGATLLAMSTFNGGANTFTGAYPQWGVQLGIFNKPWISYEGGYGGEPPGGAQLDSVVAGKFIGSISTTVLTAGTIGEGYLAVGQSLFGSGVTGGTTITGSSTVNSVACSPACTGSGGIGTYAVSASQTVGAGTVMQVNGDFYNPPYAYGGDVSITTIPSSTADWVVSGGHNLVAGNAVLLYGNLPGGFKTYVIYYVSTAGLTSTSFQLAATQAAALAGTGSIVATSGGSFVTFCQDCANIYALLYDYKFTSTFQQTVQDQFTQAVTITNANGAPSTAPGWYHDIGGCAHALGGLGFDSNWALAPCDEYSPPFYSSYTGIQTFN